MRGRSANVRRDWAIQSEEHIRLLTKIEQDEGYRITAHTRPAGWKDPDTNGNGDGGGHGQPAGPAAAAATKATTKRKAKPAHWPPTEEPESTGPNLNPLIGGGERC